MELPAVLQRGERARLFPVLADTSKEGRTLSIFLACLEQVDVFGAELLASVGFRLGARTRVEVFTEVCLLKGGDKKCRPDGLILISNGAKQQSILVEAKVGNADLSSEQMEAYLDLARMNGIETVLTLSNQFAPLPTHHPVPLTVSARRKVNTFHWSWMYVLTEASLILNNEGSINSKDKFILRELVRFLTHPSAGVKGFDQMPAAWPELVAKVQAGGKLSPSSLEAKEVIGAWHQELRDLSLILSRQLNTEVATRLSRTHAADPSARLKDELAGLVLGQCLTGTLVVPAAAAPVELSCDLQKRSVSVSMRLRAPLDKKSTRARIGWLIRQLQKAEGKDLHIRLFYPGRGGPSQYPLAALRENPDLAANDRPEVVPVSFEILLVRDLGPRFQQRKNFISDLESSVPAFYEQVGQHLKAWVPPAPRLPENRSEPASVEPDALAELADRSDEVDGGGQQRAAE